MSETITAYFFYVVTFLLLFGWLAYYLEQHRFRIPPNSFTGQRFIFIKNFIQKLDPVTIIKGFLVAVFIIILKKVVYFVSFAGIMQTHCSIWWTDGVIQLFLYAAFFMYIAFIFFIKLFMIPIYRDIQKINIDEFSFMVPLLGFVIGFMITTAIFMLQLKYYDFRQLLKLGIFAPLLVLKMLSSGQYLGLLTALVLGYFSIAVYKNFKRNKNKGFLIVPGIFLFLLIFFGFLKFPGNWQERFRQQLITAQSHYEVEELLVLANSIAAEGDRGNALQDVSGKLVEAKNKQWAFSMAQHIADKEIKNAVFQKIREKIREETQETRKRKEK